VERSGVVTSAASRCTSLVLKSGKKAQEIDGIALPASLNIRLSLNTLVSVERLKIHNLIQWFLLILVEKSVEGIEELTVHIFVLNFVILELVLLVLQWRLARLAFVGRVFFSRFVKIV
jgi:hypothetical protein